MSDQGVKWPDWISVKNKMPADGQFVLGLLYGHTMDVTVCLDGTLCCNEEGHTVWTHWMPLPPMPAKSDIADVLEALRAAGGDCWDGIDDVDAYISEFRAREEDQ